MMRLFELVSQALLVSHHDPTTPPSPAPGRTPLDHLAQPLPSYTKEAVLPQDVDAAFAGIQWTKDAMQNTRAFNAAMPHSRFKSLAEAIDAIVPDCGATELLGESVNVTGMSSMIWQNDKTHEGFQLHGPCEAWIDKTLVYRSPSCRVNHRTYPAAIPIDYSVCGSECVFKFYWLTLDKPEWRAYKQCAKISTRPKALQQLEQLIVSKDIAPLVAKLEALKQRKAVNGTKDGETKHDSTPVHWHDDSNDKKERRDDADTKSDRRDDRQDDKRGVKHDETNGGDESYGHDDSHVLRHRGNPHKPTPSPTKTLHPTVYAHSHGDDDSADSSDDKRVETTDTVESKHHLDHPRLHSHFDDETAGQQHTRRQTLPPYAFYSANTSFNHRGQDSIVDAKHDMMREGYKVSEDTTKESHEHPHRHRYQFDSVAPKPRDYTNWSTPSLTQSFTTTHEPLYLRRRQDANDKREDSHGEKKDSDETSDRTPRRHVRDETIAPKTLDNAPRQELSPTYAIYPKDKTIVISLPYVAFQEETHHRRTNTDDDKKDSKKGDETVRNGSDSDDDNRTGRAPTPTQRLLQHHDAPHRTPQAPADHPTPILHVSAAFPRRVDDQSVIQQYSAAQPPAPVVQVKRVDHIVAL